MSSANLDLVRSIFASWERGDFSSVEWAHPEIEFVIADGPAPGSWRGLAGLAEGFRGILAAWKDFRVDAEEFRELDGERVLVRVQWGGRGKTSGLELGQMRAEAENLFHLSGGKVTRVVLYFDRERALAEEPHLPNQRHLFEIPDDLVYFNCASQAPQLRSVRAAGERALTRRAAPWAIRADDWFAEAEELRALFARLIGGDADGVALIPATSYGLAVAAHNIAASEGDRVLLIADDYPSNVYTWRSFALRTGAEILTVGRREGQTWTDAILESLDQRVRVVAVPNVHWTDGALIDLARVGERAREAGALLVVDATQSVGAMPLDVSALRPDYLVATGYKWLLGPFSVAYMFVAEEHRSGRPIEENWINRAGAEDFAGLTDYSDEYRPGARRFDVGQRTNFTLTPMAIAALGQLLEWGVENIAATLAVTTGRIEREARERGLDALPADRRGPHMLGIALPADRRAAIGEQLAGANVFVGMRGSAMRVSPHLHATEGDVDALFAVLDRAMARAAS